MKKIFIFGIIFVLLIVGSFAYFINNNLGFEHNAIQKDLPYWIPRVNDTFSYRMIDGQFVQQHIREGEIIGSIIIPIVE